MKVLWFSNAILSAGESQGSGSWLFAMKDLLVDQVELVNISEGNVSKIEKKEENDITEYIIPSIPNQKELPDHDIVISIQRILNDERPDIVHIWGTEKYWSLLFSRKLVSWPIVLVEIQGLLSSCKRVFWGGLTPESIKQTTSLKNYLKPSSSLSRVYKQYEKKSIRELEVLKSLSLFSTQSVWTRNQLYYVLEEWQKVFQTMRPIRNEFYNAKKWSNPHNQTPVIFTQYSYTAPFKGVHILLESLCLIKEKYPSILLKVAGKKIDKLPFYKIDGYDKYLLKLIKQKGLTDNVVFVGSMNAREIVSELLSCDVFVNPSFVESYSAAAAEALYLGVPSVLSYAGALPDFSDVATVALYYSPMDYYDFAAKVDSLLNNEVLSNTLSKEAIRVLQKKCSPVGVKERQLEIYNSLLQP